MRKNVRDKERKREKERKGGKERTKEIKRGRVGEKE
jgi:hypothetical protein